MFIVRYSSKSFINYALTLYNDNEFFNFEIVCINDTTYYIDDGPYFDSLEHLIDHYCRIPDGLPTTLTCSVNQLGEIVQSRVQPFIGSYRNNKTKGIDIIIPSKHNFNRQISGDETKLINKNPQLLSPIHRSKFSSSLSSSIASLNSSSSRSRASSIQENSLSTSSSSASLASSSPSKQTVLSVLDGNSLPKQVSFTDRRKTVGGKIKPYTPDFNNEPKLKRLTMPIIAVEKRKSLKLNLISPDQIQQIAKLGLKKQHV
jgi:hypothetical protein